jgi:5'-nucleotidase
MRILLTNDDGIDSKGLFYLAKELCKNHDITIVAPNKQRSACSHSLECMNGISIAERTDFSFPAYSCSGTPADCVKVAILHISDLPFDLVVSGINDGPNLGTDVIYSGTVSAALEGVYMGVKSIAISTNYDTTDKRINEIAAFFADNLYKLLALDIPNTSVININYPSRLPIKGAKITKLGNHRYDDGFKPTEEVRDNGSIFALSGTPLPLSLEEQNCDIHYFAEGYVTISPVQNDRNDYSSLRKVEGDF